MDDELGGFPILDKVCGIVVLVDGFWIPWRSEKLQLAARELYSNLVFGEIEFFGGVICTQGGKDAVVAAINYLPERGYQTSALNLRPNSCP